ncbi:MAG: YlqD family protein [Cyanobacteriota bacterium]|nr:YlqD family protein [Cyanobacteriota bacterium]
MEEITASPQLLLKRTIPIKVVVTPLWKNEMQEQMQRQVQNMDTQLQQLEFQGKRAIAEIEKQTINPVGPQAMQQIESIKGQVNEQKIKLLDQKNQLLQQLNQLNGLEMDQEVIQGNVESFFRVQQGDNLIQKMQVEIVLKDGIISEIRGNP